MTDAVTMACSILSFSRMSFSSSVLWSVIVLNPPCIKFRTFVPILVYCIFSELSTNFDTVFMGK